MTLVNIDIRNIASETHPDDKVIFYSPANRNADGRIISTAVTEVKLVGGQGSIDLEPGPVVTRLECLGISDTREKAGLVPNDGPIALADLIVDWLPAIVDQGILAILEAVDAAIQEIGEAAVDIKWNKRPLTASDNLDELGPGAHPVPTGAVASVLGLPESRQGEILHYELDSSRLHRRQHYRADEVNTPVKDYRRTYYNGNWRPWEPATDVPYWRGKVPDGVQIEDMTGAEWIGRWRFDSGQAIDWDMPSRAGGYLEVTGTSTSTMHKVDAMETPIKNFQRRWYLGEWVGDWEQQCVASTPGTPAVEVDEYETATTKSIADYLVPHAIDPTLTYEADRAALVSEIKDRIGVPSLGDAGGVALVFDHGTTNFFEHIWPALKSRNIPGTLALCPEIHLDGKGDARHQASNATIRQAVTEGLVIASHSGDHGGATGFFEVHRQIVTSKKMLEEKLGATVDTWVQPGYTLSLGNYDGFGNGASASRYTDYYAGRLLQQTYPVITGASGADETKLYAGNEDLPVGIRRSRIERLGDDEVVKGYINEIIATGGKHVTYVHPYALVGNGTYHSIQDYIDFLDWLVARRDSGDLVLLTLPELAVARQSA